MSVDETRNLIVRPDDGMSVSLGSLSAIYKVAQGHTGGAYAVVEHVLQPGFLGAPPHTHANEDEISLILEGEIGVQIGEHIFTATPGTYVVKPRGIPHTFWNNAAVSARFVEIISPPGFERYFTEVANLLAADGPPDFGQLAQIADRYGLTMHMEQLPELMQRFNVSLGG